MKNVKKYILLTALLLCITGCNENNNTIDNIDTTEDTTFTSESSTAEPSTTTENGNAETATTSTAVSEERRGYGSIVCRISADEDMARLGVDKKLVIISSEGMAAMLEPAVAGHFNEVLVNDYGCDFVVEFVDYRYDSQEGGYTYAKALTDTMGMGQQADIIISGSTGWGDYYTNLVNSGLLMDITDYLDNTEEGRKLYAALPEKTWKEVRRGGRIYGCDSATNIYGSERIVCNRKKADELGLEVQEGFSFYDIGGMLEGLGEKLPDNVIGIAVTDSPVHILGYYDMGGIKCIRHGVYAKKGADGEWSAFSLLKDGEFVRLAKTIREYKEKGWITFIGNRTIESIMSMQDGDFLFYCNAFVPGVVNLAVGDKMVLTGYDNDTYEVVTGNVSNYLLGLRECTVTGIASWTGYETEALKLLTLMQTEEKLVNLLMWGIEGEDYRYVDREVVKSSYRPEDGGLEHRAYMVNMMLSYPQFIEPDNKAEYYKAQTEDCTANPFMQYGITEDMYEDCMDGYAVWELKKIYNEYVYGLLRGEYEDVDAAVAEALKLQEAVGINGLIDAINSMFGEARGNE